MDGAVGVEALAIKSGIDDFPLFWRVRELIEAGRHGVDAVDSPHALGGVEIGWPIESTVLRASLCAHCSLCKKRQVHGCDHAGKCSIIHLRATKL